MGKYDPLTSYLRRRRDDVVELSFREIERLVHGILPKAALHPAWWASSSKAADEPQREAWGAAGFDADVRLKQERVRFVRRRTQDDASISGRAFDL